MSIHLADRMCQLGTESAFEVLVRAQELERQGREVIHLEIGEPDFRTPENIVAAATRALKEGWTHYGPAAGLPQLREAIAEDAGERRGIHIHPDQVVVTPGGKPIMFFTILGLVGAGDEVLYPNPGFPIYESVVRFAGGRAVPYGFVEEKDFEPDFDTLLGKLSDRTRLVILNSPHNPTGGVLRRAQLESLAAALERHDTWVLSDEIYSRLIFEGEHSSLAQLPAARERTILLDGFSKTYAMTGWRLGYGIMQAELARQVALLMTNSNSCTATFSQIAAVEALRGDQSSVTLMREEFRRRREVMVEGLNRIPGFRCRRPHGAFYAFPNVRGTCQPSRQLADALLNEAGVACLDGAAFGAWGEGYLRFSFANSVENIRKALDRIQAWVRKNV